MVYNEKNIELEVGMVIKNYKVMCELLGEEEKRGKGKKYQVDNWKRYFDFTKEGQKLIITEVYDEPFATPELHRRREGVYTKYIECLLMSIIADKAENGELIMPKNRLYYELGMVNERYSMYYKKGKNVLLDIINQVDQSIEITLFDLDEFYLNSSVKLNKILQSSLDSMSKRKLIKYKSTYIVVMQEDNEVDYNYIEELDKKLSQSSQADSEEYRAFRNNLYKVVDKRYKIERLGGHLADSDEEKVILNIERMALNKLGCKDTSEVMRKKSYPRFQKTTTELMRKYCPKWKKYYSVIDIIHSYDLKEQIPLQAEDVRKLSFEQQQKELNTQTHSGIMGYAETKYDKNLKEYNEYMHPEDDEWGTPNPMERKPFIYNENYLFNQEFTAKNVVDIR